MRKWVTACLAFLPACVCAAELPQAGDSTEVTIVAPTEPVIRSVISAQLRSDEIAALLEHLQSQHVYLKHLENMRRALEKELSLVRLMKECDRAGGVCTGRGVAEKIEPEAPPPGVPEETPPTLEPLPEPPVPPLPELPAAARGLPSVAGIYRGTALLVDQGRYLEVRVGARVGAFTVATIALDRVELDGPEGPVTLMAQRYSPSLQLPSSIVYENGGF